MVQALSDHPWGDQRPDARLRPPRRWGRVPETLTLLGSPIVVFLGLHVRAMPPTKMIDPFFYGAYALDGPDLLRRFGTDNYFWPRVGFILPDRFFVTLFGPLAGFYTFRYLLALLAIAPLFLLFNQVLGRSVGWIGAFVVLTAPVVLTAWGTDYPDSSAISYLMGGAACVFITPRSRRMAWALLVAAGFLLGLAINSQVVATLTIIGILTGKVVTDWNNGRLRLLVDLGRVLIGSIAATVLLVGGSALVLGHWDIFWPTIHALIQFHGDAKGNAPFRSSTWRWLIDDTYVLVPPAVLGGWLVSAWPVIRRPDISKAELGFAIATAVAFSLHAYLQFLGNSWTLEFYLWTSMLWSVVCPLLVFTAVRLTRHSGPGRIARLEAAVVAGSLLGLPLLARIFRDQLQLNFRFALLLAGVPSSAALVVRYRRRWVGARFGSGVSAVAAATLLLVGHPKISTLFPGQVPYVTPDFGTALFSDGQTYVDQYSIFASLHEVVPTWDELPGGLATWWPATYTEVLNVASAQYLWSLGALPRNMPNLNQPTIDALMTRRPRVLVLLSDSGMEFASAQQALSIGGFSPRIVRQATLTAGADVLHVRVLELTGAPRANRPVG